VRIVFAGTPEVALPSLEAIAGSRHDLVAVVTRPDAAQGRSKRLVPSPVAAWAEQRGIEVLRPRRPGDPEFVARLTGLAPDCCPVVAYGALVPAPVLAVPRHGWVNVHFSLLPAWRGAAPVQRAIMAGDRVSGISVFDLVPALDAGPVYRAEASRLGADETSGDVLGRFAVDGAALLVEVLDALEDGTAVAREQQGEVTVAPKITVAEAAVDWTLPAATIDALIRACNPNPTAWTSHRGERFKLLLAGPAEADPLAPGVLRVERHRVLVGGGDGVLQLRLVQPAGKRPMNAADWGRGLGADPGAFTW
jgi:methionyl-tRNA formyltransferase